jgi:putative Mn2+ efflux pump MntP
VGRVVIAQSARVFAAIATVFGLLTFLALAAYFVGWATAVFLVLLGVMLLPAFLPPKSHRWETANQPPPSPQSD